MLNRTCQENSPLRVNRVLRLAGSWRSAWLIANTLAVVALMAVVAGPSISHHYAESSPFHSHVFSYAGLTPDHVHTGESHDHPGEPGEVLSVSDHTAAGPGMIAIAVDISYDIRPRLISNVGPALTESGQHQGVIEPPERPPRFS